MNNYEMIIVEVTHMEQLGTLHDKLDIKILILFVLNQLPAPVDGQLLYDQVFCDAGIGYFDYADCMAGLVDTAQVVKSDGKYRISEKGSRNVAQVGGSLPYTVRRKATRTTAPIAEKLARFSMITAKHEANENGCTVHLGVSDGVGDILSLKLLAANEKQAEAMEEHFKSNAEGMYHEIVRLLTESEETL